MAGMNEWIAQSQLKHLKPAITGLQTKGIAEQTTMHICMYLCNVM